MEGIVETDAVWRLLLNEIARLTDLAWDTPVQSENAWFKGTVCRRPQLLRPTFRLATCSSLISGADF